MKVGMIIYGSNGDVEMFVSLALAMIQNNHKIDLFIITINERDYSFLNKHEGLTIHQTFFDNEVRQEMGHDVEFWNLSNEDQSELMNRWYKVNLNLIISYSHRFCLECDMVAGPQHVMELPCIAEKHDTPYISIRTFPGEIRTVHAAPYWSESYAGKTITKFWDIGEAYTNKYHKRRINRFRKELGIAPVSNVTQEVINSKTLNLISYSHHLYSHKPDWPDNVHLCGYFKPADNYLMWDLPSKLSQFVENKPKKAVLISLGTMLEYENDKHLLHELLLRVAKKMDRKVIFHSVWDQEDVIDENVYKLSGFISYPKLLEHCALVVHHAGVGTAHMVAESGCPSVVITYGFEQFFNAQVLVRKGIASGSISRRELNTLDLLELINGALCDKRMCQKAQVLGKLLSSENGVRTAVHHIEKTYVKLKGTYENST